MNAQAGAGERIGILGGTFDPVHIGHMNLAAGSLAVLGLRRLMLMPTFRPPHKDASGAASAADRLNMCRIAAVSVPGVEVSDAEIRRGGASYTFDTLTQLSAELPGARLVFIMGADMFLSLETWRNFPGIARLSELCAAARHEGELPRLGQYARMLQEKYGACCRVENIPVTDVSSTQVRNIIASGGDPSALLPPGVYDYIVSRGLYSSKTAGSIPADSI